ncbi:cytochrome b [Paludibacterium paludis]|uniref:Cytochrome b n=1 Tax=Paludibacterium paludis TaxID=1225769 RepID=A0A918UC16_9NEIS|nr:cytochrome b [Paludibacterium paludis]GGY27873.1 cytochrome b [Paludibacterium paludis]
MQTVNRYSAPAIALHWLMAVLIVAAFSLALYMDGLPLSPAKFKLIGWHKWIGITVLGFAALRLVVRLVKPAPPLPGHMGPVERFAAGAGHALLYVLMFAIPLTGWTMSSAKGFPVVYLSVLPLPDLVAANETLADRLAAVHVALNWLLAACVAGHVVFALKHHLIDKDGTLWRMSLRAPRS